MFEKAATLLMSLVGNHAFIAGNRRTGFSCAVLFLFKNGVRLAFGEDEAHDVVIAVATRELAGVAEVAAVMRGWAGEGRP